jgi:hypothetical protein
LAPFGLSAVSAVRSLKGANRTRRGKSISAAKDPDRTFGSGRRELVTSRDAGTYIAALPKAKQERPEWQAAAEALIMVTEDWGPLMHAREGSVPRKRT